MFVNGVDLMLQVSINNNEQKLTNISYSPTITSITSINSDLYCIYGNITFTQMNYNGERLYIFWFNRL